MSSELETLKIKYDLLQTKYDMLKGDRDKFLATDDCYYWTPAAQKEREELSKEIIRHCKTIDELKAELEQAKQARQSYFDAVKAECESRFGMDALKAENEKLAKELEQVKKREAFYENEDHKEITRLRERIKELEK